MKRILFILPMAIIISSPLHAAGGEPAENDKSDYLARAGIVYFLSDADTPLLEIQAETLHIGRTITVVLFSGTDGQRILKADIASGPSSDITKTRASIVESNPPALYELKPHENAAWDKGAIGIGIVGDSIDIKAEEGTAFGDMDSDGVSEFFRGCTSNEGVHYTIWSGKPLEGILKWHAYYYMGYDVEPNCTSKDYAE